MIFPRNKKHQFISVCSIRYVFLFGINKNSLINKNAPAKSIQNPTTSRWCHYGPCKCSYSITYSPYQKLAENFGSYNWVLFFAPKEVGIFVCWEPLLLYHWLVVRGLPSLIQNQNTSAWQGTQVLNTISASLNSTFRASANASNEKNGAQKTTNWNRGWNKKQWNPFTRPFLGVIKCI